MQQDNRSKMMMFKSCTKKCLTISIDGSESCMDDTGKFSYSLRSKAHLCRSKLELPPLENPSYAEVSNTSPYTQKHSTNTEPLYDEVLYYTEGLIYANAIELSSFTEEHAEESTDEGETSSMSSMIDTSAYYGKNKHCTFKKRIFKKNCHRQYLQKKNLFPLLTTSIEESTIDTDKIANKNMADMDYNLLHWDLYSIRCSTPIYSQSLKSSSTLMTSTIISEEYENKNKNDIAPSIEKDTFKLQEDQRCMYKDNNITHSISHWLPKRKPMKFQCGGHVEQMIKKYQTNSYNNKQNRSIKVNNNICQNSGFVKNMVKHYLENIKKHEMEKVIRTTIRI